VSFSVSDYNINSNRQQCPILYAAVVYQNLKSATMFDDSSEELTTS
jgi:hypothetical protein